MLILEIALETLLLPEYTTSPVDLRDVKLPVPPVHEAHERVPVKVGLANGAFASSDDWREETFAMVKALFGTVTVPVAVRFAHVKVPVNVGDALFDFRSSAVCVAVDIGLSRSDVLSTFSSPNCVTVIPRSVPAYMNAPEGLCIPIDGVNVSPC